MQLSSEQLSLLPTDEDVAFYEEHGYYVAGKVLPDEVIDAAVRGAERHWAGERDWELPISAASATGSRGDGDTIRNSEYTALQNREIRALAEYPIIGAIAARLTRSPRDPALGRPARLEAALNRRQRAGRRLAHRPGVLDDLHVRGHAHGVDPAPRLPRRDGARHLRRWQPQVAEHGGDAAPSTRRTSRRSSGASSARESRR